MKKTRSRLLLTGAVLLMCTLLAGCGCGKKKAADPETEEVIKISITPEPTPTTAPEQVRLLLKELLFTFFTVTWPKCIPHQHHLR